MFELQKVTPSQEVYEKDAMAHGAPLEAYLRGGKNALEIVQASLTLAKAPKPSVIVDYPCGAGRVTRWFRAAYPEATIIASDLSEHEMDWCVNEFGCVAMKASPYFDQITMPTRADLVWCGSLVTHLSAQQSISLINSILSWLKVNGVAVITTHGRRREQLLPTSKSGVSVAAERQIVEDYRKAGHGYAEYKPGMGYGFSLTKLSWLAKWVEENKYAKLVLLSEGLWSDRQDVMAIKRIG